MAHFVDAATARPNLRPHETEEEINTPVDRFQDFVAKLGAWPGHAKQPSVHSDHKTPFKHRN
jgi:hypothetical protein